MATFAQATSHSSLRRSSLATEVQRDMFEPVPSTSSGQSTRFQDETPAEPFDIVRHYESLLDGDEACCMSIASERT